MRNEALENDLIAVINQHIKEHQLDPQTASHTLTLMAIDTLDAISWHPQNLQCARIYLEQAQEWYDGVGKPCLEHGI